MLKKIQNKIIENKIIERVLILFLMLQPILDIYFLFDEKFSVLGFAVPTIIRIIVIGILCILFIITLKNKRELWFYFLYLFLVFLYAGLHYWNALNFTGFYNGYDFGYNALSELFYIIRMLLPLALIVISFHFKFTNKKIEKLATILTILIGGSIIVTNLFTISLGSYTNEVIKGNIFCWFTSNKCNLNYLELASKGYFKFANQIAALLLMISSINFYYVLKNNMIKNYILILICMLACLMLGTRISSYGFILLLIVTILIYLFFVLLKKEIKYNKNTMEFLVILVILGMIILPFAPVRNRISSDNDLISSYNELYLEENNKKIENINNQIKEKYAFKNSNFHITDMEYKDALRILQELSREEQEEILHSFIQENYETFMINKDFILKSYPYNYDPVFWYEVMNCPIEFRIDYRAMEKAILSQVKDVNNNKLDNYLGITYTRMGNLFNLERDYVSQYYTLGIVGLLLLLSPYFIILFICGIKYLIDFKKNKLLQRTFYLLAISITLIAAYYSGNVIDGLVVNLILAFFVGQLLRISFATEDKKNTCETKIPKKIHYVWVGGKDKPSDIKKCMDSWEEYLEDYEVIEWNESNFDIDSHPFVKAAYEAKKWAYVSDYIRAYAIYNEGGIYLDTDIILLDNFDKFLHHDAFVGFENDEHPFTAAFGAKKHHPLLKKILDYYDNLDSYNFDFENNNTISVSEILINDFGCKTGNKYQELKSGIAVYPDTILCNPSKDSVAIHIFTGTWLEDKKSLKYKIVKTLKLNIDSRGKANIYNKYITRK